MTEVVGRGSGVWFWVAWLLVAAQWARSCFGKMCRSLLHTCACLVWRRAAAHSRGQSWWVIHRYCCRGSYPNGSRSGRG